MRGFSFLFLPGTVEFLTLPASPLPTCCGFPVAEVIFPLKAYSVCSVALRGKNSQRIMKQKGSTLGSGNPQDAVAGSQGSVF